MPQDFLLEIALAKIHRALAPQNLHQNKLHKPSQFFSIMTGAVSERQQAAFEFKQVPFTISVRKLRFCFVNDTDGICLQFWKTFDTII